MRPNFKVVFLKKKKRVLAGLVNSAQDSPKIVGRWTRKTLSKRTPKSIFLNMC